MSAKAFIISLSLTGSLAGLACWMMAGEPGDAAAASAKSVKPARERALSPSSLRSVGNAAGTARPERVRDNAAPARSSGLIPERPAANPSMSTAELIQRAAKVEQEANHDLKRLVGLLNLSEEQQDRVFATLVRQSPSWSPEMQAASPEGIAYAAAGRSSGAAAGAGLYSTAPGAATTQPAAGKSEAESSASIPAASGSSDADSSTAATDNSMDEIMALLSPEQQDALAQEELDRTAWWAEILDQITPTDDVPAIDGTESTGPGASQAYEGSDVLE